MHLCRCIRPYTVLTWMVFHFTMDTSQQPLRLVRTIAMQLTITREQRQAAKRQLIEPIAQGTSVRQVRAVADVPMHRTTVYRLLKRGGTEGEEPFSDGHPIKLRGGDASLQ